MYVISVMVHSITEGDEALSSSGYSTTTFGNLRISPLYVNSILRIPMSRLTSAHQLAQLLFYENGTVYNQTLIMNSNNEVDPTLVAEQGLPFYAGAWVINLLSTNLVCQEMLSM